MVFFLHSHPARLACMRQEIGLTVEKLSELVGVSPALVAEWEQGLQAIPASVWQVLQAASESVAADVAWALPATGA